MKRKIDEEFSATETKRRMEAALRGARIAGHRAMSEIAPKRKPVKAKTKPGKRAGPR